MKRFGWWALAGCAVAAGAVLRLNGYTRTPALNAAARRLLVRFARRAALRLVLVVTIVALGYGALWGFSDAWVWAWDHCVPNCDIPNPNKPCEAKIQRCPNL